jgi:hypothetical protein
MSAGLYSCVPPERLEGQGEEVAGSVIAYKRDEDGRRLMWRHQEADGFGHVARHATRYLPHLLWWQGGGSMQRQQTGWAVMRREPDACRLMGHGTAHGMGARLYMHVRRPSL